MEVQMSSAKQTDWTMVEQSDRTPSMVEEKDREEKHTHQMWIGPVYDGTT